MKGIFGARTDKDKWDKSKTQTMYHLGPTKEKQATKYDKMSTPSKTSMMNDMSVGKNSRPKTYTDI